MHVHMYIQVLMPLLTPIIIKDYTISAMYILVQTAQPHPPWSWDRWRWWRQQIIVQFDNSWTSIWTTTGPVSMTGTSVRHTLTTCNICPVGGGWNTTGSHGWWEQTFLLVGSILSKVAATTAFTAITPNLMIKSTNRPQSVIILVTTIYTTY